MAAGKLKFPPKPQIRMREEVGHWVWDNVHKSTEVVLSPDSRCAYFHIDPNVISSGTAGVRGTNGFIDGEHYWEIRFMEPPVGTSIMVGVGTKNALLHTGDFKFVNLLGQDTESWGLSYKGTLWHGGKSQQYCNPFYERNTVIGIHLDLYHGALTFYKNGETLGTAFHKLPHGVHLYPMISSTSDCTELELTCQVSRHLNLQEKCCLQVSHTLANANDARLLPLPPMLQTHIGQLRAH